MTTIEASGEDALGYITKKKKTMNAQCVFLCRDMTNKGVESVTKLL